MSEKNNITYLRIGPGEEPHVQVAKIDFIQFETGGGEDAVSEVAFDDVYILYGKNAAEQNQPMNRYIEFEEGRMMVACGTIAILGKDKNGYCSLTDEQMKKYFELFRKPHAFMMAFAKLLIFERSSFTEMNLIATYDLTEGEHEDAGTES